MIVFPLPERFPSEGLPLNKEEEASDGPFRCSAVRTVDKAATAAALCEPWLRPDRLTATVLVPADGLNAEDNAAKAEAFWVGPLWLEPFNLSLVLVTGDGLNAEDNAAKAEALWVGPLLSEPLNLSFVLVTADGLNAEDNAAKAEALWVGPLLLEPLDLSFWGKKSEVKLQQKKKNSKSTKT